MKKITFKFIDVGKRSDFDVYTEDVLSLSLVANEIGTTIQDIHGNLVWVRNSEIFMIIISDVPHG